MKAHRTSLLMENQWSEPRFRDPLPPHRRVAKLFRVSTTAYSCETIGYGASGSGQLRVGIKEETWSITVPVGQVSCGLASRRKRGR